MVRYCCQTSERFVRSPTHEEVQASELEEASGILIRVFMKSPGWSVLRSGALSGELCADIIAMSFSGHASPFNRNDPRGSVNYSVGRKNRPYFHFGTQPTLKNKQVA